VIVEQYQSAGNTIMWERDKQIGQYSESRFNKKMCRKCRQPKSAKGGTNKNFVFVCKDCNDARNAVT